jgi:hypothetical protein
MESPGDSSGSGARGDGGSARQLGVARARRELGSTRPVVAELGPAAFLTRAPADGTRQRGRRSGWAGDRQRRRPQRRSVACASEAECGSAVRTETQREKMVDSAAATGMNSIQVEEGC